jgi:hypothetical protein
VIDTDLYRTITITVSTIPPLSIFSGGRRVASPLPPLSTEDLRLGCPWHIRVQRKDRPFADPMSEALKIRARRARRIDIEHELCPLIEELRLAVGRLHDYSIEAGGVLPMSQEERSVIQAHSAARHYQDKVR